MVGGARPTVVFDFDPSLTKPLTLTLYKWILCAHLYLHYQAIYNYLDTHEDITKEEMVKLIGDLEPEKVKRRNRLIKRMGIKRRPGEDYRTIMQKAFYTYRSTDDEFDMQVQHMLSFHGLLQQLVYAKIPLMEFEKDPFKMTVAEFEKFYNALFEKYGNTGRTGFNVADIIPGLRKESDEEAQEEKKEEEQEGVEQIVIPESYSSLDRKLKEQEKQGRKTLETAEKVESVQMSASEIAPAPEAVPEHLKPVAEVTEQPAKVSEKVAEIPAEPIKTEAEGVKAELKPETVAAVPASETKPEEQKPAETGAASPLTPVIVAEPKKEEPAATATVEFHAFPKAAEPKLVGEESKKAEAAAPEKPKAEEEPAKAEPEPAAKPESPKMEAEPAKKPEPEPTKAEVPPPAPVEPELRPAENVPVAEEKKPEPAKEEPVAKPEPEPEKKPEPEPAKVEVPPPAPVEPELKPEAPVAEEKKDVAAEPEAAPAGEEKESAAPEAKSKKGGKKGRKGKGGR